ncbi:MAG: hypothetical protein GY820_44610 [Gammaproteobacteria bacterium]|nr:hypothetical protein [Gammaproteobacteria bacterium]
MKFDQDLPCISVDIRAKFRHNSPSGSQKRSADSWRKVPSRRKFIRFLRPTFASGGRYLTDRFVKLLRVEKCVKMNNK